MTRRPAKPLSDGIRNLLKQALGVEDSPVAELEPRPGQVAAVGAVARRPRRAGRRSSGRRTAASTTGPGCCAPVASPRLTCCGARIPESRTHPTRCCCPATKMRWPRSCACAGSAASPSSRSAAVPASSAAWIPLRGQFKAVVSLDLRRLERAVLARRGRPGRPNWARASPGRKPNACSANTGSRSATSRRASSSRPSAASPRPDRRARTPPDTAGSTTWSAGCAR